MKNSHFSSVILLFLSTFLFAQLPEYNKEYLQKQNAKLKEEINKLNQELERNRSQSKNSIVYVKGLTNKISRQTKLVNNINVEKRFIEDEIYALGKEINALNKELNALKNEYKDVLVNAYKNKSTQSRLLFVLSSESLVQAYRRIKYLEKYSDFQSAKIEEIAAKQIEIKVRVDKRKQARKEKNELLASQIVFQEELEEERIEKQKIVAEFEKNRGKIAAELRKKRNEQKVVDSQIQNIIKEEIRLAKIKEEEERKIREAEEAKRQRDLEIAKQKALEEERKRQEELEKQRAEEERIRLAKEEEERLEREKQRLAEAARVLDQQERARQEELARQKAEEEKQRLAAEAKAREEAAEQKRKAAELAAVKKVEENQPKFEARKTSAELSKDFVNNRGRLPWPVTRGNVVSAFGVHPHPVLAGIQVENSGVDIATFKNNFAQSVFNGTVSSVSAVRGGNKTVLVKHGNYFTVYHNLSQVIVKKGQKVKSGQRLGRIYTNEKGETILNFQVWEQTNKQNPANWISGM